MKLESLLVDCCVLEGTLTPKQPPWSLHLVQRTFLLSLSTNSIFESNKQTNLNLWHHQAQHLISPRGNSSTFSHPNAWSSYFLSQPIFVIVCWSGIKTFWSTPPFTLWANFLFLPTCSWIMHYLCDNRLFPSIGKPINMAWKREYFVTSLCEILLMFFNRKIYSLPLTINGG